MSERRFARSLGFQYTNPRGPVCLRRDSLVYQLWHKILSMANTEEISLEDAIKQIKDLVDDYGPKIWTGNCSDILVAPGHYPEYPQALKWPDDQQKIIQTCESLYRYRKSSKRKRESADLDNSDGESFTTSHMPSRNQSVTNPLEESIHISQGAKTPPHQGPVRSYPCRDSDNKNLKCTNLWLATVNDGLSAALTLGEHMTIESLFQAVTNAFIARHPTRKIDQRGPLLAIILTFPLNLGHHLQKPRVLDTRDGDANLLALREEIWMAFWNYRENDDAEEIVIFGTVVFTYDDVQRAEAAWIQRVLR
ncbi:uncharacterized protein PV09_05791 [Verruconis gallopava]|uniref:Uncharacterized protein n=1 Tax=Verruconis gallopava TaxID=253628 RepID=A0A0D2A8R8_9PEZI|nr:uncharacterized protein PV09_05791 [Verruconis gallopava]KIW03148.1 hypothetical protein PV09_05791 [Verruconis gallopava]